MKKGVVIIALALILAFLLFARRTSGFTEGIPIRQNDPNQNPYAGGCTNGTTRAGDWCLWCQGRGRLDTRLKKCLRCPDGYPVERNMKCYATAADAKHFDPIRRCSRGSWNWRKARYNENCRNE